MPKNKVKGNVVEVVSDSPERSLPSFTVSEKDLPSIKDWEVGKEYTIEVKVEMTELGKRDWGEDKGEMYGRLSVKEFIEAEEGGESKESEMTEKKVEKAYKAK